MPKSDSPSPSLGPRLAVFDCDGTLVDSQTAIVSSMRAAFESQAMPAPGAAAIRQVVGLPLLTAVRRLLPCGEAGTHARLKDGYREAFSALRKDNAVEEPLYPGVMETLAWFEDAGWLLGVATGKGTQGLLSTLETHGLKDRFATLQTADMGRGKPHPEMLHRAMAETGAEPGATVMIGDTTFDMEMARSAGAAAIGVAWGYHHPDDLLASGARMVAGQFTDLPGAARECMGTRP